MLSIVKTPRGTPQSFTTVGARLKRQAVCEAFDDCVVIEKEEIRSHRGRLRRLSRTFVVGDIHGCYEELLALIRSVGLKDSDRLISVGDLVTKGPQSREVLELFMSDSRFSAVIGNHDRALLEYWKGLRKKKHLKPSQKRCAKELKEGRDTFAEFFTSLPGYIDLGSHVVVHAGLRPGVPLAQQSLDDLTALRTLGPDRESREGTPWYEAYEGDATALFGHWPSAAPRRGPRAIGLDTGCVYGFKLTAYVVETGEFVSVPAHRPYA